MDKSNTKTNSVSYCNQLQGFTRISNDAIHSNPQLVGSVVASQRGRNFLAPLQQRSKGVKAPLNQAAAK